MKAAIIIEPKSKKPVGGHVSEECDCGRYLRTPYWKRSWTVCLEFERRGGLGRISETLYDSLMSFRDRMISDSRIGPSGLCLNGKTPTASIEVERFGDDFVVTVKTRRSQRHLSRVAAVGMRWIRRMAATLNKRMRAVK